MEAATPLRKPDVRIVGEAVVIEGLTVTDETAVRVVRETDEPVQTVTNAIEIGARMLDREHVAANTEFVKTEFEKVSKEVETAFADKARATADQFGERFDQVFDPERGALAVALRELFSDGSSKAVQNRVKEVVTEVATKSREDMVRVFSAEGGQNPLTDFKSAILGRLEAAEKRQTQVDLAQREQLAALQQEVQALRSEREKEEALEEERNRGTAKGRTFEEQVADALEEIAVGQGDCSEPVGDVKGATRKTGDVIVSIGAAEGPARGRIVFEAKNAKLSQPEARRELDRGLAERDADFAVLVVPGEDKLPTRMQALREYDGNKLVATLDPEDGGRLVLQLGYRLARARVVMARAEGDGIDAAAVHAVIERAQLALDEVRRVKSQLTGAKSSIDGAYEILEGMSQQVRARLVQIDELVSDQSSDVSPQGQLTDDL